MLSLKIGRSFSRRLTSVVIQVPERLTHVPLAMCLHANTTLARRHYSDDGKDDKFVNLDKYKVFKDDESSVILDVEEERALLESRLNDGSLDSDEDHDQFTGLNTSRESKHGRISVSIKQEYHDISIKKKINNLSHLHATSLKPPVSQNNKSRLTME